MSQPPKAPAATLVVFGATGDLAKRLLAPALVNLSQAGLLDDDFKLVGVGRSAADKHELRDALGEFVDDKDAYGWLRDRITYHEGDFSDPKLFDEIKGLGLKNAAFYLAVAPQFFGSLVDSLAEAGLLDEAEGFRRVVVEKPFGSDLTSAQELNKQILARIAETQVYRIDHFLGKETVQNIMVARFGNVMMEAVWNNRYIDHVQITAAETVSVDTRGKFYDAIGALRDMTPNHLFQMMAMIGMEPPNSFDAEAIRNEKAKFIAAVRPISPGDAVRGRYTAGKAGGQDVPDYLKTDDVDPKSRTETYSALKLQVDTWRWSGVPFYLRTGKALSARDTEIVVQFRAAPLMLFAEADAGPPPPNRLVLQIQPDEGISLELVAKAPGPEVETAPISMDFRYADRFKIGKRTGYETLLYDVLIGDPTLFQRADQIESAWRAVPPVRDAWAAGGEPEAYAAGAAGPAGADALMERDGREWRALG